MRIVMSSTAAVFYKRDGYDTQSQRLMGRQAAGAGMLKGLVKYGRADCLYCYTTRREEFAEFCDRIQAWMPQPRPVRWLPDSDPRLLAQAGSLYRPDAGIAEMAWQRRFFDPRLYSICGLTHTIASRGAMQMIGDLLIAPVQPWDALICTSQAVKTAVDHILQTWGDYLAQRMGATATTEIQLPVIPLGVDCEAFAPNSATQPTRDRLRQQLGIPLDEIVVLYVGRLIFSAKAHPVPMYLAMEQAAQTTGQRLHLVQAGWFEDQREEVNFKHSARVFCPSVNVIFVDGRPPDMRSAIWTIADIFISLADNIQETFGLTPIEAMASGLPVIVSDWNGYQETVRHEVDGLRVPTLTPAPNVAIDLATRYCNDTLNYSTYVGHAAMMAAVDVPACAAALTTLITQPDLRQRYGENGRQRAVSLYDWRVVIAAYEDLWQGLADQRQSAATVAPIADNAAIYPLCDDPFQLFAHYPTQPLARQTVLQISPGLTPDRLQHLYQQWFTNFGADRRLPPDVISTLLTWLTTQGSQTVDEIVLRYTDYHPNRIMATLLYLIKFDVLAVSRDRPA